MPGESDAYLPLKALALYSGLSVRTLRAHLADAVRPLPHFRVGGKILVRRSEFDEWVVQFETRCRHLQDDNKCGIYETRPQICREYSEESCEVNADDEGTTFYTPQAFLDYLKTRSKRIYAAVEKSYLPAEKHLGAVPVPARNGRGKSFEARFRALLDRLGAFLNDHPRANSAQFTMNVFLSLAGRIGLSHLGADHTARCMEVVAQSVRKHGNPKPGAH